MFKIGEKVIVKGVSENLKGDRREKKDKINSIGIIGIVWGTANMGSICAIAVEKSVLNGRNIDGAWKLEREHIENAKLDKDIDYYCLGWYFKEDEAEHYYDTPRNKVKYELLKEVT